MKGYSPLRRWLRNERARLYSVWLELPWCAVVAALAPGWFEQHLRAPFLAISWTCHVCGEERLDQFISVVTQDLSAEHGLPVGTYSQNVRHCNDRPRCSERAATLRL